jgi:hypothetical protein
MSSRPEMAVVLLIVQASTWVLAGVGAFAITFAEPPMALPAMLTAALVACALLLAAGLVARRRWARVWTLALEWTCLAGSLLLLILPIGAPHGLVSLMVDVGLPVAMLCLLSGPRGRSAFGLL